MKFHVLLFSALLVLSCASGADLRLGIIGCDTSHVIEFTKTLNDASAPGHVSGGEVVGAFKGGSRDVASSASRVEGFSNTLKEKYDVTFYNSIEELCQNVDAVM